MVLFHPTFLTGPGPGPCQGADVVLLALGEAEDFSGESQSRTQIVVPAAQQQLAEAVAQCGKPVVPLHIKKVFPWISSLKLTASSHPEN